MPAATMTPTRGVLALAVLALIAAGCGSQAPNGPSPVAAQQQDVKLDWVERFPEAGPALVFTAAAFSVTGRGWEAAVAIENETGIGWELGNDPLSVGQAFGVMLFETGVLGEVERRNADGELPGIRAGRTFVPALPLTLAPGESWRGTVSAPGSLASGRHVRLVFGILTAVGEPPEGLQSQVVWITDHSYRLR